MSVGKRVAEAIDKMTANDPEAAFYQIASALDATATAEFGIKGGASFKRFIEENMKLITRVAFGNSIENVNLKYSIPQIK